MATLRPASPEQSPDQQHPHRVTKRRPYTRHGYHALKRRVAWERQVAHLRGKDTISHPELTLVKRSGILEVLIRCAEAEFLERGIRVGKG